MFGLPRRRASSLSSGSTAFEEIGGPPPAQQRNVVKAGKEFHVTLLERNEFGVVSAGGCWSGSPWPEGMLDGPVGQVGGVRCRVISAEAQLWAKTDVPNEGARARAARVRPG